MVLTPSTMLELGTVAPSFNLPNIDGKLVQLKPGPNGVLVMFICNHCPYVIHIADVLAHVTSEYLDQGVEVFGINSNDIEKYPVDSPKEMKKEASKRGYKFEYLFDETQQVAKSYKAACTPDFFLFDKNLKLVYRGQFDDSRPGNEVKVTGSHLSKAVDQLVSGGPVDKIQKASIGCNIKWKA